MTRQFIRYAFLLCMLLSASIASAQTMQKQYRLIKQGTGLKLQIADAPVRQPSANEVLVRMRAASLNRRDIYVSKGQYGTGGQRDGLVPLSDGAGEVVAIGSAVKQFRVGDKVAATFFQGWIDGKPPANLGEIALGGGTDGVLTQFVTLHEQGWVKLPAHLSFEEGATLPCAGVTAWNGLVTRGKMQAGDYVLLEGTGGVSVFGLQIATAAGAKSVITSSSDAKLARAKSLGAFGTVNYKTTPQWEKPVLEITKGVGVHHVLEVGGKDTLPHALASIASGAHIALIGGLGGFGGDIPAVALMGRNASVSGIFVGSRADFEALNAFIAKHKLKPIVDKVFEFKDAQAAYDLMDAGEFFGKIVIRI